MTEAPKVVVLELEDKDVEGDISKIIKSMSEIRAETMTDRKLSDTQRDEYLHLAYRLASGIEGIADNGMFSKMQRITKILEKNNILLSYDPLQDGYWKKREKEFVQTLDDLLFSVVKDDFETIETKHHVLQAVKYLAVEGSPFKEREEVYDTILPFHGPSKLENNDFGRKLLGKLFGNQYNVSSLEELTLYVDASHDGFTEDIIKLAEEMGYTKLRVDMKEDDLKKLKTRFKGVQEIGDKDVQPNPTMINIANGLVRYTKPISYLFLGALPTKLQNRLDDILPTFNKKSAFIYSNIIETILHFGGPIALKMINDNPKYLFLWIPGIITSMVRASISSNDNLGYTHSVGSIYLKPFFYPFAKNIGRNSKVRVVEIPLSKNIKNEKPQSPIGFYESVAKMEVPEEVERNLVWSEKNHSRFGKSFVDYVDERTKTKPVARIDKENQAVVYHDEASIDGYKRYSSLVCFNDRRYLVTMIGLDNEKNGFVESILPLLHDGSENSKKLESLEKKFDLKYVNLKEYRNGNVVNEVEGFN